jgi:hypothetical protein
LLETWQFIASGVVRDVAAIRFADSTGERSKSMILRLGDRGPQVGTVHQFLIEAGETLEAGDLRDGFFGASTRLAVLDFQSSHLDARGKPLAQDGVVGPITFAALADPRAPTERFLADGWRGEPSTASAYARPAVAAAIEEIGTKEEPPGSNRGPRVDVYCGKDWLGVPWCALFVSWAWKHADGGSPFGVKASALKLRDWGAKHGKLVGGSARLVPGDIGIILRAGGRGHVELVVAPEIDGQPLSLVGGNVGNCVRGTVRERSQFTAFLRP